MVLIAPSILSADFCELKKEIQAVEEAGADWIHIDVMDGHFVPNITMGPLIVEAVRRATRLPLDVHLMISAPENYIEDFAHAGADRITVHAEACTHLQRTLAAIRQLGKKAGVSLNPATHENKIAYVASEIDTVLIMTVNPGFAKQEFISTTIQKITAVRTLLDQAQNSSCLIEVDGGINKQTAPLVVATGADVLVAGSAIFSEPNKNYKDAIAALRAT